MAFVKKIHYCWFGAEVPENVKRNIARWQELNPDFEIIKWDESNTDVSAYEFGRRALSAKRWAFVTDIVRLQKLIEYGGVYADTDVEMVSPLSRLEIHGDKLVMGYMLNCALGTAVMYAPPNHPYLWHILAKYHHIRRDFWPLNNSIFTEYFINEVQNFLLDGKYYENMNCVLYPKEMFEQPTLIRKRGISIHHACGSWKKPEKDSIALDMGAGLLRHGLKWASRKILAARMCKRNEFYDCYKEATKGGKRFFNASKYYEQGSSQQ